MFYHIRIGVVISILGGLLIGCEDDETTPEFIHPLVGVYTLTEMSLSVEATTLRDTTLFFVASQNGVDSIDIPAGTLIQTTTDIYTDSDEDPIGGTVSLRADMSATLAGDLPINWGTGCAPSVLISTLASDGAWSADTSSGIFTLDLVVDQLDIDGSFSLNGNDLVVVYSAFDGHDERMISSISHEGSEVAVTSSCISVSTVTTRVLSLTID